MFFPLTGENQGEIQHGKSRELITVEKYENCAETTERDGKVVPSPENRGSDVAEISSLRRMGSMTVIFVAEKRRSRTGTPAAEIKTGINSTTVEHTQQLGDPIPNIVFVHVAHMRCFMRCETSCHPRYGHFSHLTVSEAFSFFLGGMEGGGGLSRHFFLATNLRNGRFQ